MTRPKPVLLIVDGSIAVTGALVSAARQAELLKDALDTVLVLPRGHQVPAAQTNAFAEVIELPIVNLRKSVGGLIGYGPSLVAVSVMLRRVMQRRNCERLQLNDFYFAHGALLRLLGFRGRIVTFVRIDPARFGLAGRAWLAAARRCSTEIVAVSKFIQRQLGPDIPSRLVYEHTIIEPAAHEMPTGHQRTFLFVGNFIAGKGQDDAVAAFHRIAASHPRARLKFVGGDMGLDKNRRFRAAIEQEVASGPAPDRVQFCDHQDDLTTDYATAFAALNFSASESFSMTCLDASAAGLAVIATRCGGPEEVIDDEVTGFLVPVGDVAAMAERMAWLLDHPEKAAMMGVTGQNLVAERFSPERAADQFKPLFGL